MYSDDENEEEKNENNQNAIEQIQKAKEYDQNMKKKMARDSSKKKVQKATSKAAKKASSKLGQKVVSKAAISALGPLLPFIAIAIVIILIIIIVIGMIAFLVTMPGLMTDKLKSIGESIGTAFKSMFLSDAVASINNQDIIDIAQYITDMGYDLVGYGFVKPHLDQKIVVAEQLENGINGVKYKKVTEEETDSDGKTKTKVFYKSVDDETKKYEDLFIDTDGVMYNGKTGEEFDSKKDSKGSYKKYGIKYNSNNKIENLDGVDSSLLRTYAISNRSIYILRNDDEGFFEKILSKIFEFFTNENYSSWANGLVRVFNAENSIATSEYLKSFWDSDTWFDVVEYTEDNKLNLKNGAFNKDLLFDTDGWTGRYGLSQDLLISLHLATLSPELVETIVQSYDTEVQVYLDEVKGAKAEAKMIDTSSTVLGTDETGLLMSDFKEGRLKNVGLNIDDNWADIDALWVSRDEATAFFHYADIDSPSTCTQSYKMGLPDRVFPWQQDSGLINKTDDTGDYIYYIRDYIRNNMNLDAVSERDVLDNSYYISMLVKHFVERLSKRPDNYGFDINDFYKKVILEDNDTCATNNLVKDFDVKKDVCSSILEHGGFNAISLDGDYLDSCDRSRINTKFFQENGYDVGEMYWGQFKYKKLGDFNEFLFDDNNNSNQYSLFDVDIGEDCVFQNDKFSLER